MKNMVIGWLIVIVAGYWYYDNYLSVLKNYDDALLQVVQNAKSDTAAVYGKTACRSKFPPPPTFDPNKPFTIITE